MQLSFICLVDSEEQRQTEHTADSYRASRAARQSRPPRNRTTQLADHEIAGCTTPPASSSEMHIPGGRPRRSPRPSRKAERLNLIAQIYESRAAAICTRRLSLTRVSGRAGARKEVKKRVINEPLRGRNCGVSLLACFGEGGARAFFRSLAASRGKKDRPLLAISVQYIFTYVCTQVCMKTCTHAYTYESGGGRALSVREGKNTTQGSREEKKPGKKSRTNRRRRRASTSV